MHGHDFAGLESEGVVRIAGSRPGAGNGAAENGIPAFHARNHFSAGANRDERKTDHLSNIELQHLAD